MAGAAGCPCACVSAAASARSTTMRLQAVGRPPSVFGFQRWHEAACIPAPQRCVRLTWHTYLKGFCARQACVALKV